MREFYEHSYANVHRGVYRLAERATDGLETARRKVAAFVNAPSEREVIFTRSATEALNLVAYAWGLDNLGPGDVVVVSELEHHSSFVPWQYVAHRTGAASATIPIDEQRRAAARRRSTRSSARGQGQGRRQQPRLEHARDGQSGREPRCVGARAGRDHGRGRRPGRAAPPARRAGARLRLPRHLLAQDVRPERRRRALGPARAARGDVAVQPRRRDDQLRLAREDDLERAPVQVRGGDAGDRRGGRLRGCRRLPAGRSGSRPIERHEHELLEYALGRLGELPGSRSTALRPSGGPESSPSTSRASTRTTSRRCSTGKASRSAPGTTARSR